VTVVRVRAALALAPPIQSKTEFPRTPQDTAAIRILMDQRSSIAMKILQKRGPDGTVFIGMCFEPGRK